MLGDIDKGGMGVEKNRKKAKESWFSFVVHQRISLASEKLQWL